VDHEHSIFDAFENLLLKKSTKTILQTFHKLLETCQLTEHRTPEQEIGEYNFQPFLVEKFFRRVIEKVGKDMKIVLQNFDVIKQAKLLVQFVKTKYQIIFSQTVLCVMVDGKKKKDRYVEDLKRRTGNQGCQSTNYILNLPNSI
jgi:hypothetical protein